MSQMRKVYKAKPYRPNKMGSLDRTSYMLLRQVRFPWEYDPCLDKLTSADSVHLTMRDRDHVLAICKKYWNSGDIGMAQ